MIRDTFNSLRSHWANFHPLIRLMGVLGVLAVMGLITAGPAYRAFKHWRMDQNLIAAQLAVDETRMQEARDLSLTVLRSGDLNIQAFRILEKSAAALRDPRHGEIARALILHPDGSEEDHLTGFQAVVETMPLGIVGRAWTELSVESRAQPRFAKVFATRLLSEKRVGEAAQVLLGVPEKAQNAEVRQGLVRVLIASGKREGFEEAQRIIVKNLVVAEKGDIAAWLGLLEKLPISSIQENLLSPIRNLPEKILAEDPARVALILARMDYAAAIPNSTPVLYQTIAAWKDRSPELTAQFLTDLELFRLLLETYPVDGLGNYPGLLNLLLGAAEKTEAWDDVKELLDSGEGRMPKYLILAHRTLLAIKLADSDTAAETWRAAIAEAKTDVTNDSLLKLHRFALDANLNDLAASAMLDAIRIARGPLPLYKDLKSLCQALSESGQDRTLLEVCAIYLNFEPSNPVLLTQYAYLACLNDVIEPSRLLPPLKMLAQAFPNELPVHTTLATAYLCAAQPTLAAEVLAPLESKSQEMSPSFRIVFLASQVLAGKIPANDPQIQDFPWTTLLASERRKFSLLIRNSEIEDSNSEE